MFLRSGSLDYEEFLQVMGEKNRETDIELHYKDTFRAFSKDDDGRRIYKNIDEAESGPCQGWKPLVK